MEDLVKNIESWSLNPTNTKLLEIVKKQLNDPKTDKNKLSQNSKGDLEIAPIHAAAISNSPDLFQLVLESEGVDSDTPFFHNGEPEGGVLDMAVSGLNVDIISIVMEKSECRHILGISHEGKTLPGCLFDAVKSDRLDIVEVLLSKTENHSYLPPFDFLMVAIRLNRARIFTHVLPKSLKQINEQIGTRKSTLLHLAVEMNRVKMVRQLVEAGIDVNLKQVDGFTPLMSAVLIAGTGTCVACVGSGCYESIISELLSTKSVDLDVSVEKGRENFRALDLLNEKTCPHVRKLVEQAYTRDTFRKKLQKRKEQKVEGNSAAPSNNQCGNSKSKGENVFSENQDEDKICWSCSVDPRLVPLVRCRGCRVAWYCGEQCQEKDWPVHGPWCERRQSKREEKRKAKEEEQKRNRKLPEVFYDLD